MSHRHRLVLIAPLALTLAAGAAPASAGTGASCAVRASMDFSPGLSESSAGGSFQGRDPRGINCVGTAAGAHLLGGGTMSMRGAYGEQAGAAAGSESCLAGTGRVRFAAGLPALLAHSTVAGTLDFVRHGMLLLVSGRGVAASDRFFGTSTAEPVTIDGVLNLVPDGGTCVADAMEQATLVGTLRISERAVEPPQQEPQAPAETADEDGACAVEILGTERRDRIAGDDRGELIRGLRGDDRIRGGGGDDCLEGGSGADSLSGEAGDDTLLGGSGRDRLSGGQGDDALDGGSGADSVRGGPGADTIDAADGRADRIDCGSGRDSVRADRVDRLNGCERVRRR